MVMFLVKNNVPFDVASGCDDVKRLAMVAAMIELDGQDFDWATLSGKKREQ
jgi:hypothetical protein